MDAVDPQLDQLCINTIRFLAVDAVELAQSGHPGAPMGLAPLAYVLWDRFLKHNPRNPDWYDRDRFVLSAGHASMLLYALLHLTGYDLSLDAIRAFRQWGSKTPGHPEFRFAPGVEVTTGPLGQGFANGVGIALATRWLACHFNRPGHEIVSHTTYIVASDGDMQEGVASEAASLAGTMQLGNLICFYDDNEVSIEGSTDQAFRENVGARFAAYGWQVIGPIDGMDTLSVDAAIRQAQYETGRPSLIICRTTIGYGSPQQGTGAAHGEPLGPDGVRVAKSNLGWPLEPTFHMPDEAVQHMRKAIERGERAEQEWCRQMVAYETEYPELAKRFWAQMHGELPDNWNEGLDGLFSGSTKAIATRNASGKVISQLAKHVPALLGGSADLAPSTKTIIDGAGDFSAFNACGRNLHFGVREHAMGAIATGIARHCGTIPYTATFLTFSDYMRPPMRLAAMMGIRVIYLFTHDSIGLGEDGPTHQPIEQLLGLRSVPNLTVIRPADATETVEAWKVAATRAEGPTAIALTRQTVPVIDRTTYASTDGVRRGGYILWQSTDATPDVLLIATGSEVHPTLQAGELLGQQGVKVRVISLPSWELFDAQPQEYRESVLPPDIRKRVSVEAATPLGWERYVGNEGMAIGMTGYGVSAPGDVVLERFGFSAAHITQVVRDLL